MDAKEKYLVVREDEVKSNFVNKKIVSHKFTDEEKNKFRDTILDKETEDIISKIYLSETYSNLNKKDYNRIIREPLLEKVKNALDYLILPYYPVTVSDEILSFCKNILANKSSTGQKELGLKPISYKVVPVTKYRQSEVFKRTVKNGFLLDFMNNDTPISGDRIKGFANKITNFDSFLDYVSISKPVYDFIKEIQDHNFDNYIELMVSDKFWEAFTTSFENSWYNEWEFE